MTAALIILAILVVAGSALYIEHRAYLRRHPDPSDTTAAPSSPAPSSEATQECCGQHAVCERDSLLAMMSDKIDYYDDEELDSYKGRAPESYTDDETEQFRDVLLTLLPHDIAGWARSLQLRGITLPMPVREELVMMVSELRTNTANESFHA